MHGEQMDMLIAKYLDGIASPEEIQLVNDWYNSFDSKPPFYFENNSSLAELIEEKFSSLQTKAGIRQV